ncbi:multidrug efflux pump subunit AcrA (membrane-fusion protein) [Spirosoma lacussanchae]|uniref:HlyD family secretion protein n=1 Tax=Spirosoma lacussanchae TaxID=1884249 RepID=UPI0011081E9D|nr:HlyD family efflux transporter periplasmic adaptor subunit [Spirosoma lacussanchae]
MALQERAEELTDYSEQVREVLTRPPSGLIRWGIGIVVLGVGLLGGIASSIRYPDTLTGPVVLTTEPQPLPVVTRVNGRLGRLLVRNGQFVQKGQPLIEIENTTRLVNIPRLHRLTMDVRQFLKNPATPLVLPEEITFGDIQGEVNTLYTACKSYHRLQSDGYLATQLSLLSREIKQYRQLVIVNELQSAINTSEVNNAEKKYRIDKRLFLEKVYSQAEFLALENEYLRRKREKEEYQKTVLQNNLLLVSKEKERLNLQQQQTQQIRTTSDNIQQALNNIENLLQVWQQNYLLTSPLSGRLYFLETLAELQSLRSGDSLFAIVPLNTPLIGLASLSAQKRGKLRIGQSVIIRLADYPFEEYGVIRGKVKAIFQSSDNARGRVSIVLPDQLTTSYQRKLVYRYEMPGTVEVITDDLSLLQRALFGLRKLLIQRQ